jgi:hypothetical protein
MATTKGIAAGRDAFDFPAMFTPELEIASCCSTIEGHTLGGIFIETTAKLLPSKLRYDS